MITIKNPNQIDQMRKAGVLLHSVLQQLKAAAVPGATTRQLDALANKLIRDAGAIPSFLGVPSFDGGGDFPGCICASVNDEVVHGFPRDDELQQGDILSIDCGVILDGWQSDSALTVPIGQVSEAAAQLIRVTEASFWAGIRQAVAGNRIGDISHAVEEYVRPYGYQPVRALCGHGIGREMHEDPEVPNFGPAGHGPRLRAGMVIAVEPMISAGTYQVHCAANRWTYKVSDGSLASHYEHTIVITPAGLPEVLSCPGHVWKEEAL